MDIKTIIDESILEFNKNQNKFKITNSENFELIGKNSSLDSMAVVQFLLILEKKLSEKSNKKIDLVNKVFNTEKNVLFIKDLVLILKI